MLSQKPEEHSTGVAAPSAATSAPAQTDNVAAVQALMEVIQASPEFQMANDFTEYLTSPMDESPWEDMLTTPALGTDDMSSEFLTSPAIVDADDFGHFGDLPLFSDGLGAALEPIKPVAPPPAPVLSNFNFDGMYTMPSPNTPSLDPSSLNPSPRVSPIAHPASNTVSSGRKNNPTGTRKNITPEALVPYDAPIQTRKYVTPSATSRKEVPAVFARKRSRSAAFGEDDQLADEFPPSQSELDAIEAKRRQNTLAARRSRKRKLEYQRELEEGVERERLEKEAWKSRAVMLEALLKSHGVQVPL